MSASGKKKARPKAAPVKKKGKAKVAKTRKAEKLAPVAAKPKKEAPAPKKAAVKKEAPPKMTAKPQLARMGPPPMAVVTIRHLDSMRERSGRGFSFGELSSAGIPLNMAKRQDVSVDVRRRNVVDRNVEALKGWLKQPGQASGRDAAEKQVAVAAVSKKK